jgi:pyocin large subunit-like protein
VKLVDGKPMWSASRKFSAAQNAQRAFDRNGQDFGARDLDASSRRPTPSSTIRPRAR